MSIFQVIAVLFALFMLYVIKLHRNRRSIAQTEAFLWFSLWLLFIVIAIFPDLLLGIAHALTFQRVFDLLVVAAFMILSVMVFLGYFRQKRLEERLERYVRKSALDKGKKQLVK